MMDDTYLSAELAVASGAARAAGAAILPHYGNAVARMKPGNSPVTEADFAANEIVLGALREAFPDDAILSEESADTPDRLSASRVWIVDPLDGTREFLNGTGDFAVMIGLAVDGYPVLGVIYRPVADILYTAAEGRGAWSERDGKREQLRCVRVDPEAIRLVGSRSHPEPLVEKVRVELGVVDATPIGSVAIKCASIAEGSRDLYLHPVAFLGEWDTCAPEVLVREAGGHVMDCRGAVLRYNKPIPNQPDGILATGVTDDSSLVARIVMMYEEEKGRG
jgi:3'(2'), 5'-bisphosphate nucleotidase